MYKRILVPIDGSDTSNKALATALQMAREAGGKVRLLHAIDEMAALSGYEYSGELLRLARERATGVLADALATAQAAGVPAETQLVEAAGARLSDSVAEDARIWEADLLVVGTHGRRGISRMLLGSGAEQIIRTSVQPVMVVRGA